MKSLPESRPTYHTTDTCVMQDGLTWRVLADGTRLLVGVRVESIDRYCDGSKGGA